MTDDVLSRPGSRERRSLALAPLVMACLLGLVVLAVTVLIQPSAVMAGMRLAGPLGGALLLLEPVGRGLSVLAFCGVLGSLVLALGQVQERRLSPVGLALGTLASRWAVAWAAVTVVSAGIRVLTLEGASEAGLHHGQISAASAVGASVRGLVLTACAAGLVAVLTRGMRTRDDTVTVLVLAIGALVPSNLTGHAVHAGSGPAASFVLIVHVVAVGVWVGALLGIVVHAPRTAVDSAFLRWFSSVALCSFVAAAISGAAAALIRAGWSDLVAGGTYSTLLLVKVCLYLLLGTIGWWHRRVTMPAVDVGDQRAFRSLVAGELVVMVLAIAVGVVLSGTPTNLS